MVLVVRMAPSAPETEVERVPAQHDLRVVQPGSEAIVYSAECLHVLRGGGFEARRFLAKPRKNASEEEMEAFRSQLRVVDLMNSNQKTLPGKLLRMAEDTLQGFTAKPVKDQDRSRPSWHVTYMHVEKLPKYWRAEFLVKHYSQHGCTEELVVRMDSKCSESINNVFDFVCGLTPTSKLPRSCLNKRVCDVSCKSRADAIGRATKAFFQGAIGSDGSIDWGRYGCYRVTGTAETPIVIHTSGDEAACLISSRSAVSCCVLFSLSNAFVH